MAPTLIPQDLDTFARDGVVRVPGAFAAEDAAAMQDEWWAELADVHGVIRDDPATWRQIAGDLKRPKTSPLETRILTPRLQGAIDALLGAGAWEAPRDWGRVLVTFPEPGGWDVPAGLWHWDAPLPAATTPLPALFVVSFVGRVEPRGGGTLVLAGSHRLIAAHQARLTARQAGDYAVSRELFHRSHPWLAALAGKAPSPPDRIAAFMEVETEVDGVPARVVELTAEPGDVVLCHPSILHAVAPNRGVRPRFMRIKQQLLTREGRRRVHLRSAAGSA
jgi:hypothetical protein